MRKFILAAPLALAAAAVLATPASAASVTSPASLRAQISALDHQADAGRRGISPREAAGLNRQVDQLQDLYARYARGGFTRVELNTLGARINAVRANFAAQKFDRNDHRGPDGRSDGRHDRDDHHEDRDHDQDHRR